jgi:hypothetical protein
MQMSVLFGYLPTLFGGGLAHEVFVRRASMMCYVSQALPFLSGMLAMSLIASQFS